MKADTRFLVSLIPAIEQAGSVEVKYRLLLSDSIFSFLNHHYGCHPVHEHSNSKSSKKPNHDRALKMIKQLKTKARRDLRKAKTSGALVDEINALGICLVRQQSKISKKSKAVSFSKFIKFERDGCHKTLEVSQRSPQ